MGGGEQPQTFRGGRIDGMFRFTPFNTNITAAPRAECVRTLISGGVSHNRTAFLTSTGAEETASEGGGGREAEPLIDQQGDCPGAAEQPEDINISHPLRGGS